MADLIYTVWEGLEKMSFTYNNITINFVEIFVGCFIVILGIKLIAYFKN